MNNNMRSSVKGLILGQYSVPSSVLLADKIMSDETESAVYPTLAPSNTWYKGTTSPTSITEINIVNSYTPTGTETESWTADVEGTGSIMCYVDGAELIIAGNGSGKIMANENSCFMFCIDSASDSGVFSAATVINGLNLFDTSNVISMRSMFYKCSSLTSLDLSSFDTSNVATMRHMFHNCTNLASLDLSNWNTSNVIAMNGTFYQCTNLISLDVSGFDTNNVTTMAHMFRHCSSLTALDLSSWNTSNVTTMSYMFYQCNKMILLDLSSWDVRKLRSWTDMFNTTAVTVRAHGWVVDDKHTDCGAGTVTDRLFQGLVCDTLDLSNWDTSRVTRMRSTFYNCTRMTFLNLSGWDTSNVTDMVYVFETFTGKSTNLTSLDLSGWDTSNVTAMSGMFDGCTNLTSLDLSGWDTSNVTAMSGMFSDCTNLTSLDLSSWDTSNVMHMVSTFQQATSLKTIYVGSGWTTENANTTDMFYRCGTSTVTRKT